MIELRSMARRGGIAAVLLACLSPALSPSGAAEAAAPPSAADMSGLSGTWASNNGDVELEFKGDKVTGRFLDDEPGNKSQFEGEVAPDGSLIINWTQTYADGHSDTGKMQFRRTGPEAFEGTYGYRESATDGGPMTLTRKK